ncbi:MULTISPECIES: EthD domain-containing protein [Ralstonia]|uniref:EthD domain-containing protein n=1 Tax=Ralstonia chuxiongensis TaxID=2957504 RepID=A0AA41WSN2_9RALS|nr:EthD domain-containing protein [Ralstonia chuxiongensis]MCP1172044.1 EthD domain-containing protein [Ralstonia chuxiongensis]
MIKMIAAVCRRPGMTHAEYVAYVQHVHGAISNENPVTLRRYVQNHVFDAAFGSTAEPEHSMTVARDSVTELYWDNAQDMSATFAHEHVRTNVGPDAANFADASVSLSLVAVEAEQPVVTPKRACGAKVLHYLRAAEGLSLPEFFDRWSRAHELALAAEPLAAAALRRCVHNRQVPEFNAMLAYFSATDVPAYEGVASLWFDDVSSVGAFRAYERALLAINANATTTFYRPAQSFFLYATEVPIYERS